MTLVFLSGPLLWRDLIGAIIGDMPRSQGAPSISGYAWVTDDRGIVPILAVRADDITQGQVVRCDDTQLDRLAFFLALFGMGPATVDLEGASCTVFVSSQKTGQSWQPKVWAEAGAAVLTDAAQEIMGYFKRMPAGLVQQRSAMILARAWARHNAVHPVPSDLRGDLKAAQVSVSDVETKHEGFFLTKTFGLRHVKFNGAISADLQREVFVATDAAIVLPYDPVRDRVLLVEQFRMGPFGRGDTRPWVLEPVAGRVDAGEDPTECALRESREEAGLDIHRLEHVSSHYCSPGCSTEFYHCYVGLCDLPDLSKNTGGLDTEHEDIRTHVISFDRARALVDTGEANIGPLVLLLLWLERERARLRAT